MRGWFPTATTTITTIYFLIIIIIIIIISHTFQPVSIQN